MNLDAARWMGIEPGDEDDGEECDHPNAIELMDHGTYIQCWCPDCESEFDSSL